MSSGVETLRKPSTGLKRFKKPHGVRYYDRRDTQKTQHGIETRYRREVQPSTEVETLRKPSTGLKPSHSDMMMYLGNCRDTQKTQHGIETAWFRSHRARPSRSRHSENPARD